ncbi:MAG TPA: hypothetical protein VKN18_19910 [Blastocatellia bacterium]|nr:hypothetical protein [Blastocatellia bacterium]
MLVRGTRRLTTRKLSERFIQSASELVNADPDYLRDSVRKALLSLSLSERSKAATNVLYGLRRAGVRVRECLLMLGSSASTAEELTASEVAALIRYVRLNQPGALQSIATLLTELLIGTGEARASDRAA